MRALFPGDGVAGNRDMSLSLLLPASFLTSNYLISNYLTVLHKQL